MPPHHRVPAGRHMLPAWLPAWLLAPLPPCLPPSASHPCFVSHMSRHAPASVHPPAGSSVFPSPAPFPPLQQGMTDEREIKRLRRKQSNRESAR